MKQEFEQISKSEKNEHTALILMLGILGEKLAIYYDCIVEGDDD